MTGKVLDRGATGILVLILPIAFLIVVVFAAWPYLLLVLGLSIAWQVWQIYQWQEWSSQVNPYFSELVKENQGCLTVMDLSLKTNMTGRAAKRFLDKKAEEYGAQRQEIEDKGVVYYFLTASALGSIFEESEPLSELEISELESQEIAPEESPQLASASPEVKQQPQELSAREIAQLVDSEPEPPKQQEREKPPEKLPEKPLEKPPESQPESFAGKASKLASLFAPKTAEEPSTVASPAPETASQSQETGLKPMIQGDLAKRLDVHSSTVGKRKNDPDFSDWSQSKDPDGIAWKYSRKRRMYVPIESD